jgi:hypothetical protein
LASAQGDVIGLAIQAQATAPTEHAAFYRRAVAATQRPVRAAGFVASERHTLEANYYDYARQLKREARRFSKPAQAAIAKRADAPSARPIAAE